MTPDLFDANTRESAYKEAKESTSEAFTLAEQGDFDTALEKLAQVESLGARAGLPDLVTEARINAGFIHSERADNAAALEFYTDAVGLARESQDKKRLSIALANVCVTLRDLERYDEAIESLTDYLEVIDGDDTAAVVALYERASCRSRVGEIDEALAGFEEALEIARRIDQIDMVVSSQLAIGMLYEQKEDPIAAGMIYREAADLADQSGLQAEYRDAVTGLARAHQETRDLVGADAALSRAEESNRALGDREALADALHTHAVVLSSAGRNDEALEKLREEEDIRRDLAEDAALGDCLALQAAVLRAVRDYEESIAACEAAEQAYYKSAPLSQALADTLYWHARLLRRSGELSEALQRADAALAIAAEGAYDHVAVRLGGVRAMVLCDMGEHEAAAETLDAVEAACATHQFDAPKTWTLGRRAYALACTGASTDDVITQLRAAYHHAVVSFIEPTGRAVVRKMCKEIKAGYSDQYGEQLDALYEELEAAAPDDMMMPAIDG